MLVELTEKGDTITAGYYTEGEKTGLWKENVAIQKNGVTINYGNKEGNWKSYYSDDKLYFTGSFMQGNPDGKHIFYYANGKVQEERFYQNSIKTGNWSKYNENGELMVVITYKNNEEYKINGIKILESVKK